MTEENGWTADFENLLEDIRINSVVMHEFHKDQYFFFNEFLKYFRIPTIFLSAVNVFASVGLQPYIEQGYISLLTCGISLVTGIINSLELYLNVNKRKDNEIEVSREYYLLAVNIHKMLAIKRENRPIDGKTFLDEKFHAYCKIIERSTLLSKRYRDKLAGLPANVALSRTSSAYSLFSIAKSARTRAETFLDTPTRDKPPSIDDIPKPSRTGGDGVIESHLEVGSDDGDISSVIRKQTSRGVSVRGFMNC